MCDQQKELYCNLCNKKQQLCLCGRKRGVDRRPELFCDWKEGQCKNFDCKFLCCKSCSFYNREKKKGVIPNYCYLCPEIKHVKDVSCEDQSSSVRNVTNDLTVVPNLPEGARLHQFWKKWTALGVSPKVLTVLREGYTLPFRFWPNLTRSPTITSCYVNPHRNLYLLEALHQLLDKNAVELVNNQESLGFYNWLFMVPKPNNRLRPILDLSNLNKILKIESFKMETPETIRTSLQAGKWVTSIDFIMMHTSTYQKTVSPGSTCVFTSRARPTNLKHYHLVSQQHQWSLQ